MQFCCVAILFGAESKLKLICLLHKINVFKKLLVSRRCFIDHTKRYEILLHLMRCVNASAVIDIYSRYRKTTFMLLCMWAL